MVKYVSKSSGQSCNNDATAKAAYLNTPNPDCVPLCFFAITNQGTFRTGGSSQAYSNGNNNCGYSEFQYYNGTTSIPDCPLAGVQWTRFRNFSSALQVNCPCCNSKQGSCNTPSSCQSTQSVAG